MTEKMKFIGDKTMKIEKMKERVKGSIENRTKHRPDKYNVFAAVIKVTVARGFTCKLLCLLSLSLVISCKHMPPNDNRQTSGQTAKDTVLEAGYIRPEIPQMMSDPQQRALYYVNHYWDGYSLADTAFIRSDDTEQLFADFIGALQYVALEESSAALKRMMCRMEADSTAYARFCTLSEKYLYEPNSPMRNEDYYIPVLEQMIASQRLSEVDKIRPTDRLKQANKNRPGMTATDFSYVTPNDKAGRMSRIKAGYTLLFFYDPDCTNCRKHEEILSEMPAFIEMQEKGIVRVLAVYPDEEENEWLLNSSKMPPGWIVGWNKQGDIRSKTLYEIRATPTMYLLDKQKKVILKDASMEQLIRYLAANFQMTNA